MSSRSFGVQALALVLSTALCGCSIVGLGYRAAPKHKTGHQEAERLSQLAQMYERQGHPSGAMRLYRQALQADPRSQSARERLMALSSQQAAPPQAPARATPSLAPAETTLLAQTQPASPASPPSSSVPNRAPTIASAASPALAPEPPTTSTRAAAPRSTAAAVQPSPTTGPQANSVVAESASAVAAAAAPILALMSRPTGNLSLRDEPEPLVVDSGAPVLPMPEPVPAPPVEFAAPSPVVPLQVAPAVALPAMVSAEPRPLPLPAPLELPQLAPPAEAGVARVKSPPRLAAPVPVQEEPLAVAVVKLPPPASAPRIHPESTASESDWTSSHLAEAVPQAISLPAALPAPAAVSSASPEPLPVPDAIVVAIRPQQTVNEPIGRSTLNGSAWSTTDLVRLCPDATEELLAIVKRLESPDATIRKDALVELAQRGDAARPAVGAVRWLVHDSDPRVKSHAAWAVCRIAGASEDCVAVLAGIACSDEPAAATFAAYCLGLLEQDALTAVPSLQAACASENTSIRLCAAEALLRITPEAPEPLSTLIEGLHDPAPEHRWLAAISLSAASSVYQESAVLALIPVLHDPSTDVCSSAALALGAYGAAAAAAGPDLLVVLSHSDADVREAAAAALECIVE